MKKVLFVLATMMLAVSANAQVRYLNDSGTPFEAGKMYVNAALSNASLSYSKAKDFSLGVNGKAGYFFIDNLMGVGVVGVNTANNGDNVKVDIGAGARWYFDTVGIYVGGIAKYVHEKAGDFDFDDFRPEVNAGYTFFLNRNITVEPEAYFEHSFKDSDYSGFGVRVGLSIYFNL